MVSSVQLFQLAASRPPPASHQVTKGHAVQAQLSNSKTTGVINAVLVRNPKHSTGCYEETYFHPSQT